MSKHAKFDGSAPAPTQAEMLEFVKTQNAEASPASMAIVMHETLRDLSEAIVVRKMGHQAVCDSPPCKIDNYIQRGIVRIVLSAMVMAELENFELFEKLGEEFIAIRASS